MRLEGKVAVITGGEGPLGREVTKKFLAEGAKLVISWYAPDEWEEARALIPNYYKGRFVAMRVDATMEDQVENLMKEARDEFGSVDILLHLVGLLPTPATLWETDIASWDSFMNVNLKTAFLCCKHAVRALLAKGRGHIVVFTAKLAIQPWPLFGADGVSKAGLITLTEALREELKDTNITVNAVMPDVMDTWRTRSILPDDDPDKWVKPSDVANLLCCLCSDECDALSGSILKVFGKL